MAVVLALCVFAALLGAASAAKCPCEHDYYCSLIGYNQDKEVLGFVRSQDNWKQYKWSALTTIAMFTDLPPELMCYAHSKDVKVVLSANYPMNQLNNVAMRSAWIKEKIELVQASFADGLNIDIEGPIDYTTNQSVLLTDFVAEIYTAFKTKSQYYQISFDVAWSPDCIDGRCYQAAAFSEFTDFLVVMAYDERSQIRGPCVASANSALNTTAKGLQQYISLGITPDKLVLGLPWYGYDYPCLNLSYDDVCTIKKVPFRGVNCSDAAGKQKDYGEIRSLVQLSNIDVKWDARLQSPYFHYKADDATDHQVWYDNVESLSFKYTYARQQTLHGLAIWNIDSLDYSDSPLAQGQTAEMWDALALFSKE